MSLMQNCGEGGRACMRSASVSESTCVSECARVVPVSSWTLFKIALRMYALGYRYSHQVRLLAYVKRN